MTLISYEGTKRREEIDVDLRGGKDRVRNVMAIPAIDPDVHQRSNEYYA